nr:unnamed protein product [Callosobruchus chinensis]
MWKILCAESAGRQLKLQNTSSSIVLPCAEEEARIWKLFRSRFNWRIKMCDGDSLLYLSILAAPEPAKKKLWRIKRQSNPTAINEEIILRNLKPLQENIQKKIQAQEAYYSIKEGGMSSAFRRRPVKARLGLISIGPKTKRGLRALIMQ